MVKAALEAGPRPVCIPSAWACYPTDTAEPADAGLAEQTISLFLTQSLLKFNYTDLLKCFKLTPS